MFLAASLAVAAMNDLSVAWISREPRIDYVWNSSNPKVEGWPREGDTVTWVAHVRWLGAAPLTHVGYRWSVDHSPVHSGTLDFQPGSIVTTELPWTWTFTRHQIEFVIDPDNAVAETEERNNRLAIDSNALAVGIWVEDSFRTSIQPLVVGSGIGASTFDDWIQRQIRRFNEMAASAIYPDTPEGVIDRWRIDAIHFVPDAALPLVPPYTEARDWGAGSDAGGIYPDVSDHTVDMQWGFPAATASFWNGSDTWTMTIGNSIVHELGHARTMIDVYSWNVAQHSARIGFSPAPPAISGDVMYSTPLHGLMHFGWGRIDPYTAAAMNRMAGTRAVAGNYNEPWNLGWFLNDLPAQNRVRLLRPDGTPIANAPIRIYQSTGETIDPMTFAPYGMVFPPNPAFDMTTDSNGVVVLGRNPFGGSPIANAVNRAANGTDIVQITDGNTTRWAFLDSLLFNMAYWRGDTEEASYTFMADAPACLDSAGSPAIPAPEAAITADDVTLLFPVVKGHTYDVYYTVDGGTRTSLSTTTGSLRLPLPPGRIVWWYVDRTVAGNCLPKYSSVYAFDHLGGSRQMRRRAAGR